MSSMIESSKVISLGNRDKKKSGSTQLLTFHIPDGMKANISVALEISKNSESSYAEVVSEKPELKVLEQKISEVAELEQVVPVPAAVIAVAVEEPKEISIQVEEIHNDVIPYFSLKLKNPAEIYKIGTSYLKDIAAGKYHFGFTSISKQTNDLHLLVYASFINYSLKKPVLVVVKDIEDKAFDKYRENFTSGTLWKWQTKDWGNLCFIDYKQINNFSEELRSLDLNFITSEFVSVLWALPNSDIQDELQKASLLILDKVDSITFVVSPGESKNSDLKKSTAYYQCFDIPLKGVLIGEGGK